MSRTNATARRKKNQNAKKVGAPSVPRRAWCFTVHETGFEKEDGTGFVVPNDHEHFKYCVYQMEACPDTGSLHYQGYVEFKENKRIKAVKKLFQCPGMHLEPRQGTAADARNYCMKADTRVEGWGPFEYGKFTGQGARSDLGDMVDKARRGVSSSEICDAHPGSYARYYKAVQHIRALAVVDEPKRTKPLEVVLMIGKPGTGKTRAAYDFADGVKKAMWAIPVRAGRSMWFDNYVGQPIVLLDDFSGGMPLDQLLRLIDRYPVQVEVKGGHVYWCPETIIVTTNVHPKDWYDYSKRTDSMAALKRRFTHVLDFDCVVRDPNTNSPYYQTMEEYWKTPDAFDILMAASRGTGGRPPENDGMDVDQ